MISVLVFSPQRTSAAGLMYGCHAIRILDLEYKSGQTDSRDSFVTFSEKSRSPSFWNQHLPFFKSIVHVADRSKKLGVRLLLSRDGIETTIGLGMDHGKANEQIEHWRTLVEYRVIEMWYHRISCNVDNRGSQVTVALIKRWRKVRPQGQLGIQVI